MGVFPPAALLLPLVPYVSRTFTAMSRAAPVAQDAISSTISAITLTVSALTSITTTVVNATSSSMNSFFSIVTWLIVLATFVINGIALAIMLFCMWCSPWGWYDPWFPSGVLSLV
ncbi:hypothetical protein SEUCBS139899_005907 [Sporothrix eucalyptigena]